MERLTFEPWFRDLLILLQEVLHKEARMGGISWEEARRAYIETFKNGEEIGVTRRG